MLLRGIATARRLVAVSGVAASTTGTPQAGAGARIGHSSWQSEGAGNSRLAKRAPVPARDQRGTGRGDAIDRAGFQGDIMTVNRTSIQTAAAAQRTRAQLPNQPETQPKARPGNPPGNTPAHPPWRWQRQPARTAGLRRLLPYQATLVCRLWRGLFPASARPGDRMLVPDVRGTLCMIAGAVDRRIRRHGVELHGSARTTVVCLPSRPDPWRRVERACGRAPAAARDGTGR